MVDSEPLRQFADVQADGRFHKPGMALRRLAGAPTSGRPQQHPDET
ncbi:hypothetical protein ACWERW_20560 [Streptomyces sp. NPDC004012]